MVILVQWSRFLLQVTGHRSQVIVLPIQKVSQTLVKANLRLTLGLVRPKQTFLGLRLAFKSVWYIFCIGKTMTCDLQKKPAGI